MKKIGSFICISFPHSCINWRWERRRLKEENSTSVVFLQRAWFVCIKPSINAPTAEENFSMVTSPLPEIMGNLLPMPLSKPATLCSQGWGAGEGAPIPHDLIMNHWPTAGRVTHGRPRIALRFAGVGSVFAWGGFCGGHVCVQTFTYSNTGQPSRCSYKCKLTARGRNRRRRYSARASQRGEQPHLLLKSSPQRRAKNSLDAVGKVSVLAEENGYRSRKDKNIKIN